MVRNYKRSTERAKTRRELIIQAVRQVKYNRITLVQTSEDFDIPLRSLARYCKKISYEELEKIETDPRYVPVVPLGYSKRTQVFII